MNDDRDEPLEGDIGPAPTAIRPETQEPEPEPEPGRDEAEREERRRRVDTVSGRVAAALAAAFLALLLYDSVRTAVAAHAKGDDRVHPPVVVAGVCAAGLVLLAVWAVRGVRRR